MTELSAEVAKQLLAADEATAHVVKTATSLLEQIQGTSNPQSVTTHLERAQAVLAIAHTVHALHTLLIRTSGRNISTLEPVIKESKRLEMYEKKVNKAVTAHILQTTRPTVSLNVAAGECPVLWLSVTQLPHCMCIARTVCSSEGCCPIK